MIYGSIPDFTDKRKNTSSIPNVFDAFFAPFTEALTYTGSVSSDGARYTLAFEIPRLIKDSITVTVEPTTSQYKTSAHKIAIKATQEPLGNYSVPDHSKQETAKPYQQDFILYSQQVALDGSLKLYYSQGVLVVEIPLQRPVQTKKQALSARLSDLESLA
jgi:HSP20 family molecular chaperone IbpA